ncbi:MAG: aldehyde dehydrogenase family protein, partial [Bradyrhizobium icense]
MRPGSAIAPGSQQGLANEFLPGEIALSKVTDSDVVSDVSLTGRKQLVQVRGNQVVEGLPIAIKAARRTFDEGVWSPVPAIERGKLLVRVADAIRDNKDLFAAAT